MTSKCAVGIAAFLHIVLRISFFMEQRSDGCSTAPTLASWIFLIAFLDILLDMCIYPVRYMHLPYICQIIAETFITIFLTEFGSLLVWCTIEKISCKLCKSLLLLFVVPPRIYYVWETYILGIVTTSTSLAILLCVGQATDHYHFMHKRSMRKCRKINSYLSDVWSKVRSVMLNKKCIANNVSCYSKQCGGRMDDELEIDAAIVYQPKRKNIYKRNRSRSRGCNRKIK